MKYDHIVETAYSKLKDFQRSTVDYAVEQFKSGQSRYLIADEVGLGKTIIAKGIIARLYQNEFRKGRVFNVIYICSNQALAKQNLSKLSFITQQSDDDKDADKIIDYSEEDDRLTALAYEPKVNNNKYELKIKALTPATSFDNKTSAGKSDERVLIYRILKDQKEFSNRKVSLKWFLRGGRRISMKNWISKIEEADTFSDKNRGNLRVIREEVFKKFYKSLNALLPMDKHKSVYNELNIYKPEPFLNILLQLLPAGKQNRSFQKEDDRTFALFYGLIPELRFRLSIICKDFLKADLFVLDEFQKYSSLISIENADDDPGTSIAKGVFSKKNARVLMLSATPFKTFSNSNEELNGEDHFQEFRKVLNFLLDKKDPIFWKDLDDENRSFFKALRIHDVENQLAIKDLKSRIESKYRSCMARTERSLVEVFSDEFVDESVRTLDVNKEDIVDFITIDKIIQELNNSGRKTLPVPIEYVKSSPYALSFLQDYEHLKVLLEEFEHNNEVQKIVKKSSRAWVPEDRIINYKPLLPESKVNEPNPKLRLLYDETVRNKGWQLLWIPPGVKYYNVNRGAYVNTDDFTKTIIFSSWKLVPRMISALVSYEAERLSVGAYISEKSDGKKHKYHDKKRYPFPLLTFKNTDENLTGINNFMLCYPSVALASLYNPVINLSEKKTVGQIRTDLSSHIKVKLMDAGIKSIGSPTGDWQKWWWYSAILLDKQEANRSRMQSWAGLKYDQNINLYDSEDEKEENGKIGKKAQYLEVTRCITDAKYIPNVSIITDTQLDQISDHLANLCLGSPAISSLRSFDNLYPHSKNDNLRSAFVTGTGFISMFNKQESIAIVNKFENEEHYFQNVLNYCIDGNIQSMLDEFIYQLKDSNALADSFKAAELITNILAVQSGSIEVKTLKGLSSKQKPFKMRTHYAAPFGLHSGAELKSGGRQIKVREAFNSPFRPFVLTSTSIGQEGLDFHYYCSKIIHWNLPGNPIDLEQREGRIKRFKGFNIRKKVANKYLAEITRVTDSTLIWEKLFELAENDKPSDKCDLLPFWHMDGDPDNDIKTIIPLYPFSKDFDKLKYIKNVLGNYRLTFGQPRQEELIAILGNISQDKESKEMLRKLLINLCPITYG